MKKHFSDYTDENGLVVQKNGDGGDSLNRTCMCYIFAHLILPKEQQDIRFETINQLAEGWTGKYRRSIHPNKWYSNFDRTSRDQLIPLLILIGLTGWYFPLRFMFRDHLKRGLLWAYNTRHNFQYPTLEEHIQRSTPDVKWNYRWKMPDFTGPEFWALYIRGFKAWPLYPLLWLFDIQTLLGSVFIRFNNQDDVINHAVVLEYAKVQMDTWIMKLARKVMPRVLIQQRLDTFFGRDEEPPINELYRLLNK